MQYEPDNLKKWTTRDPVGGCEGNYAGDDKSNHYVVYLKTRDATVLEESNYQCILRELYKIKEDADITFSSNHWAVGYIDWIIIHKDENELLKEADKLVKALEDYPILDEHDFSEREFEYACESWRFLNLIERVELIREYGNEDYPMGFLYARYDSLPGEKVDSAGMIYEQLTLGSV